MLSKKGSAKIQAMLKARKEKPKREITPARYDNVFFEAMRIMDEEDGLGIDFNGMKAATIALGESASKATAALDKFFMEYRTGKRHLYSKRAIIEKYTNGERPLPRHLKAWRVARRYKELSNE